MIHVACSNEECVNRGAPYTTERGLEHDCPLCGEPMGQVDPPSPPDDVLVVEDEWLIDDHPRPKIG